MTPTQCAFRSDHPDVLSWLDDAEAKAKEWREGVAALEADFPDHHAMVTKSLLLWRVAGLGGNSTTPGLGWRRPRGSGVWVPDKRTHDGKEYHQRLTDLAISFVPIPGLPDTIVDSHWHHPGLRRMDGFVLADYGCPIELVRKGGWSSIDLDEEMWTAIKLSEFYAAIEAKEAANA